jgi:3-oxoacyl-[acyl-carrier protein] reductase
MLNEISLKSKTAIVNGCTGGMGSAIAKKLAENGYSLALLGRNQQKLNLLEQELSSKFNERFFKSYCTDTFSQSVFSQIAQKIIIDFQQIDALINAAGIVPIGGMLDVNEQQWEEAFNINLISVINLVRAFFQLFINQSSGKIILVNGLLATQPEPGLIINSTTTGAIRNFAKALAKDLGKYGVKVNTINPGPTNTQLWEKIQVELAHRVGVKEEAILEQTINSIPLGKLAVAEDIANIVNFLCSDQANHINGAMISVDGGCSSGY